MPAGTTAQALERGSFQMTFTRFTIKSGRLLAATTLALTMLTTASFAYSPEQQQMCTGDAMRLCGEYIPDVDRITACMVRHYDSLSDGCRSVFEMPQSPAAAAATPSASAPTSRPSKPDR